MAIPQRPWEVSERPSHPIPSVATLQLRVVSESPNAARFPPFLTPRDHLFGRNRSKDAGTLVPVHRRRVNPVWLGA
jgi:hypothetical protein